MKATELRIGNLVMFNNEFVKVQALTEDNVIETEGGYMFDLKPIPLTESKLIELGFHKHVNHFTKDKFTISYQSYNYSDVKLYLIPYNNPIEYLHQLQNLYFLLTGKELIP